MAALVVGSTVYPVMPPSLRTGLQVLGTTTSTAISRILAEQSRGDAIADLEAVIRPILRPGAAAHAALAAGLAAGVVVVGDQLVARLEGEAGT